MVKYEYQWFLPEELYDKEWDKPNINSTTLWHDAMMRYMNRLGRKGWRVVEKKIGICGAVYMERIMEDKNV